MNIELLILKFFLGINTKNNVIKNKNKPLYKKLFLQRILLLFLIPK